MALSILHKLTHGIQRRPPSECCLDGVTWSTSTSACCRDTRANAVQSSGGIPGGVAPLLAHPHPTCGYTLAVLPSPQVRIHQLPPTPSHQSAPGLSSAWVNGTASSPQVSLHLQSAPRHAAREPELESGHIPPLFRCLPWLQRHQGKMTHKGQSAHYFSAPWFLCSWCSSWVPKHQQRGDHCGCGIV